LSAELKEEWVRGSAERSLEHPDGEAVDRPAVRGPASPVDYLSQIFSL